MPFKVLLFAYRKPGLSPTDFRNHLEVKHLNLLKQLFGPIFPVSHVRHYIHRSDGDVYPATVLVGSQEDFEYDVISELTFEDENAFKEFFAKYQSEDIAVAIKRDEELFLDSERTKAVVLGEVLETTR